MSNVPEDETIVKTFFSNGRVSRREFHPNTSAFEKVDLCLPQRRRQSIIFTMPNKDRRPLDDYETAVQNGRSYMVGMSVSLPVYFHYHVSYITEYHWLRYAVEWAFENPDLCLIVKVPGKEYHVYMRGDYVEIALPYHGKGGEKYWIVNANNRRRRLLVNVD